MVGEVSNPPEGPEDGSLDIVVWWLLDVVRGWHNLSAIWELFNFYIFFISKNYYINKPVQWFYFFQNTNLLIFQKFCLNLGKQFSQKFEYFATWFTLKCVLRPWTGENVSESYHLL